MKEALILSEGARPRESAMDRWARRAVHRSLERITRGRIVVEEPYGSVAFGSGNGSELSATLRVHDPAAYRAIALGGTIGAGRAYVDGLWSCEELPTAVRIFAANESAHYGLEGGLAVLARPFRAVSHFLRRNTPTGSRRNISDHYDLGNDFYRLFLDETMMYSCGVFEREDASMRDASEAKLDRICDKLALSPEDHLLEIGTGWGGLAVHAARRFGCRVTTTTISTEQRDLAARRVDQAGLAGRVEVLLRDYRDLTGTYDKLVSVEMIEAVGYEYFDAFFSRCASLLRGNGRMLLQAITIADQDFERHRKDVDFIKRYIFPGACIPSVTSLLTSITRASDLRLFHLEDITRHYVTTLQRWREAFRARLDEVRSLGHSARFVRKWDFYLAYCEGGFAERYLGDVQMLLVKPGFRPDGS